MTIYEKIAVFVGLIFGGFLIESLIFQTHYFLYHKHFKKYHYQFGRYLYYLLFPIVALIFSYFYADSKVIFIFLAFSLVGSIAELLAGFFYHMIVGQRLWTYHRFSIGGYTSLFSVPLWGTIGVLFWLLNKII